MDRLNIKNILSNKSILKNIYHNLDEHFLPKSEIKIALKKIKKININNTPFEIKSNGQIFNILTTIYFSTIKNQYLLECKLYNGNKTLYLYLGIIDVNGIEINDDVYDVWYYTKWDIL